MEKIPTEQELIKQMINNPYSYAAIYSRISGRNQSESLDTQEAKGKELAFNKNLLVYKVYKEEISATKNKINDREALYNMLEDAKAGYFKYLIVFRRDRLARVFDDYLEIKNKLLKYGVTILFTNDFQFQVDSSPLASFVDNIIMAVAELEPKYIRERVQTGIKAKKERGEYSSKPPYGLKIVSNSGVKEYVKNEDKEPHVKAIFETFLKDNINTISDLYIELINKRMIPETLKKQQVEDIITNPIYAGLTLRDKESYHFDGFKIIEIETEEEIPIDIMYFTDYTNIKECIISKDKWLRIAEKLSKIDRKKTLRIHNPFRKLLFQKVFCKMCNEPMKVSNKYYRCERCRTSIKYTIVNDYVKQELAKTKFSNEMHNKIKAEAQAQIINRIKKEEKELLKKTVCIREMIEQLLEDTTDEDIRKSIESLVKEENVLRNELQEDKSRIRFIKNMDLLTISQILTTNIDFGTSNYNSLKEIVDCFVEKVVVDRELSKKCAIGYRKF